MNAYMKHRAAVMNWQTTKTMVIAFSLPMGWFSSHGPTYLNTGISKMHITVVLAP